MAVSSSVRDISVSQLSNGIYVITEPMPAVRSVAAGFWVGTGSRCESPQENGISHFIEHMLFKGTETRSAEDIARQMDSVGGNLDAFTGRELVGYNTKVLDEHLPLAFEILTDMLRHPRFDPADIQKERGVILEEMKMEADNPESYIHELFVSNFWKRHPLGRPIIGTRKTLASFGREQLRSYHSCTYRPGNLTVTAAGNLDHARVVRLAEEHLGSLPAGGGPPRVRPPRPSAPLILKSRPSLQQVHVCAGVPTVCASDPLRFAAYTLNVVLGGGMSSRLFQNIRERQGLAYSIFSELNFYEDAGLLAVYAGTSRDNARRLLEGVMAEIRRLKNELLPEDELRHAKDYMKGSLLLSLESTSSRMGNLARQWLTFRRFYSLDELAASIEAVSAADVQLVARQAFENGRIGLALLGRVDEARVGPQDIEC